MSRYPTRISILGVGSLGGHIAVALSKVKGIKSLTLYDDDIVEESNLDTSVFCKRHVEMAKVEAINDIIKYDRNIEVICRKERVSEVDHIKDFVIDCRDVTYPRRGVDVRLYVSYRHLVVDCAQNTLKERSFAGGYKILPRREDLLYGVSSFVLLFISGSIDRFIRGNHVEPIPLDRIRKEATDSLSLREQKEPCIYEDIPNAHRIRNVVDHVDSLMKINDSKDLEIYVGDESKHLVHTHIGQKEWMDPYDVLNRLASLIQNEVSCNYYFIAIQNNVVNILPDVGGA